MNTAFVPTDAIPLATILKIQKLLALAACGGATEGEASSAIEKAQYLMSSHNLHMADVASRGLNTEARLKSGMTDRTVYKWRRDLMAKTAKLNFCYCTPNFTVGRKVGIFEGFTLIGRESNVASTRVMYDYLVQTIERLAREHAASVWIHMFARGAIRFREGCAERLVERLDRRYRDILDDQERKAQDNRRANEQYAGSTLPTVVLRDYAREEKEANYDLAHGKKIGTSTRARKEREAQQAAIVAYVEQHGVDWSIAYDVIVRGIDIIAAAAEFERLCRQPVRVSIETGTAETRKRRAQQEKQDQRYRDKCDREYAREAARRNDPGFVAGLIAADGIGLDAQVDNASTRAQQEQRKLR